MTTLLIFISIFFALAIAVIIYAAVNSDKLYTTFIVNPVNDGIADKNEVFNIELKNKTLSVTTGIIKKQILFSAPVSDCEMAIQREYTPKEVEVIEKDKSVILRAVAGGVLLGPVGAVVGGMSGIGTKKNTIITQREKTDTYVTIKSKDKEFLYKVSVANNDAANAIYRQFNRLKVA